MIDTTLLVLVQDGAAKAATSNPPDSPLAWLSALGVTGAAAATIVMAWLFLREGRDEREKRAKAEEAQRAHIAELTRVSREHIAELTKAYTESNERNAERTQIAVEKFSETATAIHKDCQASGERREQEMRQLLRESLNNTG